MTLFAQPQLGFDAAGVSIRGASHDRDETQSQDAFRMSAGICSGQAWGVFAVADGHGAKRHDRSGTGAALACEAAIHCLGNGAVELELGEHGPPSAQVTAKIARAVQRRWRLLCQRHHSAEASDTEEFDAGRYGTTLAAVYLTPPHALLLRIGDSDVVSVSRDGIIQRAFEPEEAIVGSATWSLALRRCA